MNTDVITEPTPTTLEAAPTAVVRHPGVTVAELRPLFDGGYPAILKTGVAVTGPPFAVYRGDPDRTFDLELGFPLAEPLPATIEGPVPVQPSQLPAGRALTISHLGSYGSLPQSWGLLDEHARSHGLTPSAMLEVYVSEPGPDVDPTTLRTDLYLLVG